MSEKMTNDQRRKLDEKITETLDYLLGYARELQTQWCWKNDELGQFSDDYLELEANIESGEDLLCLLETQLCKPDKQ